MAATGRYKSRLLNYVIERSQDFKSQAARGFRYARTSLNWGAQALLYPIYVAFQTSRVVGRRLQSATGPKQFVQLPKPPDGDASLQALLEKAQAIADQGAIALESSTAQSSTAAISVPAKTITLEAAAQVPLTGDIWELEETTSDAKLEASEHPTLPSGPEESGESGVKDSEKALGGELATAESDALRSESLYVRGIASSLKDRAIVLADNHNRLVTVSAEQQWELQQQIVRQVADFAYRQRQYRLRTQRRQQPLPPPKSDRPNLFPVVRWSRDLMGWMQRSPVAQKTNLFGERQLPPADHPPSFPLPDWDPQSSVAIALTTLERVDAPLAQLEHTLEETYTQQIEPGPVGQMIRRAAAFFGMGSALQSGLETGDGASSSSLSNTPDTAADALQLLSQPSGLDPDSSLQFILGQAQAIADQEAIATSSKQLQGNNPAVLNPASGPLAKNSSAHPLAATTTVNSATEDSATVHPLVSEGAPSELGTAPRISLTSVMEGKVSPTISGQTTFGQVYIRGIASALDNRALLLIDNQNRPIEISAEQQWALQAQIVGQVSGFPELQETLQTEPQLSSRAGVDSATLHPSKRSAGSIPASPANSSTRSPVHSSPVPQQSVAAHPANPAENSAESSAPITVTKAGSSAPTWKASYIETTATVTGYIKHPLEWVLEKLDRLLLWVEQAIASVWHWIQLRLHPNR